MNYWPYTLIFIFSCLTIVRLGVMLVSTILSNEPKSLGLNNYERVLYGLSLSYMLTYLIYI
jgi:hypothetical protein